MIAEHVETRDGRPLTLRRPRVAHLEFNRRSRDFAQHHRGDIAACAVLIVVSLALTLLMVIPIHSFVRGDWPAQFFPTYAFLGERLRAFDIPGWNPFQFSGAPFAGDPESGWMYLPAMAVYGLLPAETATAAYIGLHIACAALALYAFARLLGLDVAGSLIGGASFAFAWVAPASMHMVIFFPVAVWLVVALAGVELAVRAGTWAARLWSWLLATFAISQILAIWLGQASYYALIVIGGWIAWRTLLVPDQLSPLRARLAPFLLTSLAVFGFGFGLAAAGVLPRLAMVEQSSLAGGVYDVASAWEEARIGFSPPQLLHEVLGGYTGGLWWYAGATAVALAVMAPVVARRWRPIPFFVLVAACSLILALAARTPLHAALYAILPRFEGLHEHSPERVLILFFPAVSLLAAATVSFLPRWDRAPAALAITALAPAALALVIWFSAEESATLLSREVTILIVAASALVACFALIPNARVRQTALVGLIVFVLWDPAGRIALRGFAADPRLEPSLQETLTLQYPSESFLYANGAATFLQEQTAASPGRYAGFEPAFLHDPETIESVPPRVGYRSANSLSNPVVYWLLVHNWGTWFGVEDVQGYNPIQSQRYVAFIDALNGHRQEYHERDLFPAGLASPLLDLLNVRYLVVPADAPERPDLTPLLADFPPVYADAHVAVLENPEALPRAWLVHQARQVAPGQALGLLGSGTLDARQVALLETAPPPLAAPADPAAERVRVLAQEPDRLVLEVRAQSPALLVLSAVWDPGWQATVNGESAPVLVADHALRAVPIPAGEHDVVLSYQPPWLREGLLVTSATLIVLVGAALWMERRRPAPGTTEEREP